MTQPAFLSHHQILQATAAFFGEPVLKLTAPGGRSRTSLRAYFADRSIIVSQRRDLVLARIEVKVLKALQGKTAHVPRLLGQFGTLVFQSDVGPNRLNWAIYTIPPSDRLALAAHAIDALFDMQRAAQRVGLGPGLPTAPIRSHVDDDLIPMVALFAAQTKQTPIAFDPSALSPLFRAPPCRFVKWDCRAGNAALGDDAKVRWFDFEESRFAQGPEDFAWLISDEAWPVDADQMLRMIRDRLTREDAADPYIYRTYLEEFTALQAIRRIRLILRQARSGGWLDRLSILKFDKVGANPHMGERLSLLGARLADRNASIRGLKPLFEHAAQLFREVRIPTAPPPA